MTGSLPFAGAIGRRFAALPPNTRGFVWFLLSTFAFTAMIVFVRLMSGRYNTGELAFWRAFLGLILLTPVFLRHRRTLFRTDRLGFHLVRNVMHFVGVAAWFFAVSQINLSVGMALQFTVPLFTIVMAIFILRERVDAGRWIATAIGFAGVLIVLRPGAAPVSFAAMACMVSAVGYAGAHIATKILVRTCTGESVVFWMNAMHLPFAIALALAIGGVHQPPLADLPGLFGIGFSATLAHWLMARAFAVADASLVVIADFTKLPTVALAAFVFFGEVPVVWAWIGGAVIFASTYYIVQREARAGNRRAETGKAA